MKKIFAILIKTTFFILCGVCILSNVEATDTNQIDETQIVDNQVITQGVNYEVWLENEKGEKWEEGDKVYEHQSYRVWLYCSFNGHKERISGPDYELTGAISCYEPNGLRMGSGGTNFPGIIFCDEKGFGTIKLSSPDGLYEAKVTLEVIGAKEGDIVPKNKDMAEFNSLLVLNTYDEIELEMEYKDMGVKKRISENIMWESSKSDIVSIDSNGKVVALKEGKATITAIYKDGEKTVIGEEIIIEVSDDKTSHLQKEPESEFEKGFKGLKNIILNIITKIIYNIRKLFNINL